MHVYHVSFHAANAWTDLSKLPKIPSLGKLNAKVKELNTSFDFYATPGEIDTLLKLPSMLLSGLYLSHVVSPD